MQSERSITDALVLSFSSVEERALTSIGLQKDRYYNVMLLNRIFIKLQSPPYQISYN